MNREHVLTEIARTAAENGGIALGQKRFYRETGIKNSDWFGKYWARWSDAVREAGCTPSSWQGPMDEDKLLGCYIRLIRELGHFPVSGELKLKARQDPDFPDHKTFQRFGNKAQQVQKIVQFCESTPGNEDVLAIARAVKVTAAPDPSAIDSLQEEAIGYVYLLRVNRYYKIGRSVLFERRSRELAIQLPEKAETVHVIRTDDPVGIELYWHRRFEKKRKNGEWFELSVQDVKAFNRRKFM